MPGVWPAVLQKTTKYTIRTSDQPTPAIAPTSHAGRSVPIMEAIEADHRSAQQEDEMREQEVDRERDAASGEAAVAAGLLAPANARASRRARCARCAWPRAISPANDVVWCISASRTSGLESTLFSAPRNASLCTRRSASSFVCALSSALVIIRCERGALKHPAGELAELLLVERRSAAPRPSRDCLRDDALDDAVLDDRASDRLRAAGRP